MISTEFYATLNPIIQPACKRLEMRNLKRGGCCWACSRGIGTVFFEIRLGPKLRYIPPLGGQFQVCLDVVKSGDAKGRTLDTCMSWMQYLDEAALARAVQIRDDVIRKITSQQVFETDLDRQIL